jgi:signal peptidase I
MPMTSANSTKRHPWRRLLALVAGLAAVGASWFFLAPSALGGSTAYVVTEGVSMQPRFHTGDLALVRATGVYQVGDIVAYRSRQMRTIVLHRIVAVSGDRYVFKGDNNSWRDPESPTRAQLVGKLWLHLPGVGGWLRDLRTPPAMAILAGLATVLLLGGAGVRTRRRHLRRRTGQLSPGQKRPAIGGGVPRAVLIASLTALAACLALAIVVFARPTRQLASATEPYSQSGAFSYTARASQGAVYPDGLVTTGQPLFLRLVDRTQVRFVYMLNSTSNAYISGTASLDAELTSTTGWTHTTQLQPPTPFTGPSCTVGGMLELKRLQALVRRVEALTAIQGGSYTVTVRPHVIANGVLAGRRFTAVFAPSLPLTFNTLELQPSATANTGTQAASALPFHVTRGGAVAYATPTATTLAVGHHRVTIEATRIAALIGANASLCAALLAALLLLRARRADEPTRIQAKYHHNLITVGQSNLATYTNVVELPSFRSLVRLAEHYDSVIIHEETDRGHSYRVADNGTLYIYLIHAPEQPEPSPPPHPAPPRLDPNHVPASGNLGEQMIGAPAAQIQTAPGSPWQ